MPNAGESVTGTMNALSRLSLFENNFFQIVAIRVNHRPG